MRRAAIAASVSAFLAATSHAQAPDGLRWTPELAWKRGDHELQLGASVRARGEYWNAFVAEEDVFGATKTRVELRYAFRDQLFATVEGQHVQLLGMDATASGAELVYRSANDGRHDAGQLQLRKAHVEWRPVPALFLRAGRQDVRLGAEIAYPEPDWRYLKTLRLAERLVGKVGWSHVERANDAITGGYDFPGHRVDGFVARPTTGVFEVDRGMRPLHDVSYGGAIWTVKRDTLLPDTELSLFGLVYDDERPVDEGGLADGVRVYTFGASWLGVYDVGPGRLDALLWVAAQTGDFDGDDHRAAAGLAEVGWQMPDWPLAPWLRAGVNVASGDGDPGDGDHRTFANLLPTNHPYYGFADQLAFQNLVDSFLQLRLRPHPRLGFDFFVHWFRLVHRDDAVYAGTGAFDRDAFGYAASASGGQSDVGVEYDASASFALHRSATLDLGFSWLDGGDVYRARPDRDVTFAYASIELRY